MNTKGRLDGVYYKAEHIPIDESSRYVFFSDCHRGDDSVSDEFTRNQTLMLSALQYYYDEGYVYVEDGDGDELFEYGNFKTIRAAHIDIFTAMKAFFDENRMIMIFGNHNLFLKNPLYVKHNYYSYRDEYLDRQRKLFYGMKVHEGVILDYEPTGQEIFVVHGHQGDLMNDQLWWLSMFLLRYFWRFVHVVGFKNPASPAKNQYKRHKIEKNYCKWLEHHNVMLICGHTHRLKFPRKGELPYFNIGCCVRTKGITAIEIRDGKIMVVEWRVRTDNQGFMQVRRKVIHGPRPIKDFEREVDE